MSAVESDVTFEATEDKVTEVGVGRSSQGEAAEEASSNNYKGKEKVDDGSQADDEGTLDVR